MENPIRRCKYCAFQAPESEWGRCVTPNCGMGCSDNGSIGCPQCKRVYYIACLEWPDRVPEETAAE